MAISLARVALNRIYPASIYSRPALSPMVVGADGKPGSAQENLNNMYKYTLQQMAVSPFSVNSQEYMKRIREEYGYSDTGFYDAMGTVGSVVGAGMGAMFGANMIDWKGFRVEGFKKSEWYKPGSYQFPFEIKKPDTTKREGTSEGFRQYNRDYEKLDKTLVNDYNTKLDAYTTDAKELNKVVKNNDLSELNKATIDLDGLKETDSGYAGAKATVDKLRKDVDADVLKQYDKAHDAYKNSKTAFTTSQDALTNSIKATKGLDTADAIIDTVKSGAKIGAKAAGALMGIAGTAMDVGSLGMNIAGAAQAFSDIDIINGMLYTVGAVGDVISIAGDVAQFIPVVGTVLGTVANIVGTAMSALSGAIIGARVGETVGHSLTPEGARAQALFAENLYGSIAQRPLTSITTVLTTVGVPALLNRLSSGTLIRNKDMSTKVGVWKPLQKASNWLVHDAWGNYARSALTMMATQGINSLTTKLEDTWIPPEEAADVNFVTAFSVVGDLNDNLFGATQRKATLLGLASGDASAQTKAIARAWGQSNEDIYYNPSFDDIRQATGIDLGNLGNSIVSTIGEILVDPQNISEIAEKLSTERTAKKGMYIGANEINITRAKIIAGDDSVVNDPATKLIFNTTDDGHLLKTVKYNKDKNTFEAPTKENNSLENVQVYKVGNDYFKLEVKDNKVITSKLDAVTDIYKAYDNADYSMTYLGNKSKDAIKNELYAYYTAYLLNGREGVSSTYISKKAQITEGSKYVLENASDRLFVDNMTKFIENVFKKETKVSPQEFKQHLTELQEANPEEFKQKFQSLYNYYGAKESGDLINAIIHDFDMRLNNKDITKLYNVHEGFRNQMDMIENATGTINKLANPMLTLTNSAMKFLQDLSTTSRSFTEVKQRADLIVTLGEIGKKYTPINTDEIEEAKKEIEANKFVPTNKEEVAKTITESNEVKQTMESLSAFKDKYNNVVEQAKQDSKDIEEFYKGRVLKDYTVKDATTNKDVIVVTENNIKDVYNEIKTLNEKPHLAHAEKKRLMALTTAFASYGWNDKVQGVQVDYLKHVSNLFFTIDAFNTEVNKVFVEFITMFNKFKVLTTSKDTLSASAFAELEDINKFFTRLGIEKSIEIKNENITLEDAKNKIANKQPVTNKLRMYYKVDLAEYLCTLLNSELRQKYNNNEHIVGIQEVDEIRRILNGLDFTKWKEYKKEDKINAIKAAVAKVTEPEGATSLRAYLLSNENNVLDVIVERVNKASENAQGNSYIVDKALSDVDMSFLKRTIMHHITHKEGFSKLYNSILKQVTDINKYLNEIDSKLDESDKQFVEALKINYKSSFEYLLKHSDIYDMITNYIYTTDPTKHILTLASDSYGLYKEVKKETMAKINKGDTSIKTTQEYHQQIATAPYIEKLIKDYDDSMFAFKQQIKLEEPALTEDEVDKKAGLLRADEVKKRIDFNMEQKEFYDNERKKIPFDLDSNKPSKIIKAHYNLNTKGKSKEKFTTIEAINDLLNKGQDTRMIDPTGHVTIELRPTYFLTEQGTSEPFRHFIKDEDDVIGVDNLTGYKFEVETFIDNLFELASTTKGALTIEYKKVIYKINKDGSVYDVTNKKKLDAKKTKTLKENLVMRYIRHKSGSKNIILKYNSVEPTPSGFIEYSTANYYKKFLFNELTSSINELINKGKIKAIPSYNGITPTYSNAKEYVKALHKFISWLKDNNDPRYDEYNTYINDIYAKAKDEVNKELQADSYFKISKRLKELTKRLEYFESSTIQSRNLNRPVIANDLIKRAVAKDPYFRKLAKSFNQKNPDNLFMKQVKFFEDYIIESEYTTKKFNARDFTKINIKEDGTYTFTHKNGFEVSLVELILEYRINREKLNKLLDITLPSLPDVDGDLTSRVRPKVENVFTEVYDTIRKHTTKETFVKMIASTIDKDDADYATKIKDAENAYDTLYNDLRTRSLVTELEYSRRIQWDEDKMSQIEDAEFLYNDTILNLYNTAKQKHDNDKRYKGLEYKDLQEYFLVELLLWRPKTEQEKEYKRKYLNDIFFLDFKAAQSIFSDAHKKELKELHSIFEQMKKEDTDNPYYDIQLKSLEQYMKYCDAGNLPMETKSEFLDKVMMIAYLHDNSTNVKDILKIFNNHIEISDTKKYIPVLTNGGYKLVTVNIANLLEQKKRGAGALNIYIMSRFYDKFTALKNKGVIETKANWEDAYGNVFIVKEPTENAKDIKLKYKQDHPTAKRIYVVDIEQFKDIQKMFNSGEIISYTETLDKLSEDGIHYLGEDKAAEWETTFVENRINVKAQKTVPAYMQDLNNINKYLTHGTFKKLYKYIDTYNKYPMLLQSYLEDTRLTQTKAYKNLKANMEITNIFFELVDKFEGVDINLDVIGEYFTNDYIKKGVTIQRDTPVMYELQNIKIGNTNASDILVEAIADLHKQYKDSTIDFRYSKVLDEQSVSTLFKIQNTIKLFIEHARKAQDQGSTLMDVFNKHFNKDEYDLKAKHVQEQQDFNETKWNELKGSTLKEKIESLSLDYKRNKKSIDDNYINRKHSMNIALGNLKNKNLNFKTTHAIINAMEEAKAKDIPLFIIKDRGDQFEIQYSNDLFEQVIDKTSLSALVQNLRQLNMNSDEVYDFIYTNIIFPFVQNIAVEFKSAPKTSLEFFAAVLDPAAPGSLEDVLISGDDSLYIKAINAKLFEKLVKLDVSNIRTYTEFIVKVQKVLNEIEAKLNIKLPKDLIEKYTQVLYTKIEELRKTQDESVLAQYAHISFETAKRFRIKTFEDYKKYAISKLVADPELGLDKLANIISAYVLNNNPSIKEEINKLRENKGISKGSKYQQKTKIDDTDFNLYEYRTSSLKRDRFIMFKKGISRDDQIDVKSISDNALENVQGAAPELKTLIDTLLLSISKSFSRDFNMIKDKDNPAQAYLDDFNIKTTKDLYKNFYDKSKYKDDLTYEQYIEAINSYNLFRTYVAVALSKKDKTQINEAQKHWNNSFTKVATMFENNKTTPEYEAEQAINLYNEIMGMQIYLPLIYQHKPELKSYKDAQDMVYNMNSDVMNISTEFYTKLKHDYNNIKDDNIFGLSKSNLKIIKKVFYESSTLSEFYRKIYDHPMISDKQEVLYKMIITINHMKELYKEQKDKGKSWIEAIYKVETGELASNVMQLEKLYALGQNVDDGFNILPEIYRPLRALSKGTRIVQSWNNALSKVVVDNVPSYVKTVKPETVIYKENEFTTTLRQLQNYTTRPLFKNTDKDPNLHLQLMKDMSREFQAESLDLIQEMNASSLEECVTSNTTFHNIRNLFTEVLKLIDINYTDSKFVRVLNVTEALRSFEESAINKNFYAGQFDLYSFSSDKDIDKAINDIVDFFNSKNYLIDMNDYTVKAIFGYIHYHKYNKDDKTKRAEYKKFLNKYVKKQADIENSIAKSNESQLYKITHSTNLSHEERIAEAAKLIYKQDVKDLDKTQKETLTTLISIADDELALLKEVELFDTYDIVIKQDVNPEEFALHINKCNTIEIKRNKVDKTKKKLAAKEQSIKKKDIASRTIKHVVDNKIISTEEKITTSSEQEIRKAYTDANDNIDKQIEAFKHTLTDRRLTRETNRRNIILEFVRNPACVEALSIHSKQHNEYMDKLLEPIKKDIDDNTKYLNTFKIFTEDILNKYKEAKLYKYINPKYECLKNYMKNFEDDIIIDILAIDYETLNIPIVDIQKDIEEFKEHMEALNSVRKLIAEADYDSSKKSTINKKLDAITRNVRSVYNITKAVQDYNNIDWTNVDEQSYKYAENVYNTFIKDIKLAKREVSKGVAKEFYDAVKQGKDAFTTSELKEATEKRLSNKIKYYITGTQSVYDKLLNNALIYNLAKDYSFEEFTNNNKELKSLYGLIEDTFNYVDYVVAQVEETITTISKEKNIEYPGELTKDILKEYIKPEYLKDLDKNKSKKIFKEIVRQSIKDNKDISEYLIKDKSDMILYHFNRERIKLAKETLKLLEVSKNYITTNRKEYNENLTYYNNLKNMLEMNDPRIQRTKDILIKKYGEDLVNANEQYISYEKVKDEVYEELKKNISDFEKAKKDNLEGIKKLDSYKNDLEKVNELRSDMKTDEENLDKSIKTLTASYKRLHKVRTDTSNYKLYCKYFGEATPKEIVQRAKDEGLIDEIEGDIDLHNADVDTIITMYNTMYIKGMLDDPNKFEPFIVFDMETAKDANGTVKPYQMSILKVEKIDGKIKATPVTVYCSAYAFMDGTVEDPGPCLKEFISQQKTIYRKEEPNITDEEVNKRVQAIIDKVAGRKNTLAKTQFLINALSRSNLPIVAHNGKRFDFINFNNYISTNIGHLVRDLYLDLNLRVSVSDIKKSITGDQTLKNVIEGRLKNLTDLYNSGEIYSDVALKTFTNTVTKLVSAAIDSSIKDVIGQAYKDMGLFTGKENSINLFTDEYTPFDDLQNKFIAYYRATDEKLKEEILQEVYEMFPDKDTSIKHLFETTAKNLFTNAEKEQSIINMVINNLTKQYNLDTLYEGTYNHEARLNSMLSEINSYMQMAEFLKEDPNKGYEFFTEFENKIKDQIDNTDKELAMIEKQLANLKISQNKIDKRTNDLYNKLYDMFRIIRNKTLYNIRDAKMAIHEYRDTYQGNKQVSIVDKNVIDYNINKAQKDIEDMYNSFQALLKALDTEHERLQTDNLNDTIRFEPSITSITTAQGKTKQLQIYTERINELKTILENLDTNWEESWNNVKASTSTNIDKLKKEFIDLLLLIKDNYPEFVDKILSYDITSIKDLDNIRTEYLNYIKTNDEFKKFARSNDLAHRISTYFAKGSTLRKYFDLAKVEEVPELTVNNKKIITELINYELTAISNSSIILQAMIITDTKVVYGEVIDNIDNLIKNYKHTEKKLDQIKASSYSKALFRKTKGSIFKGDDSEYAEYREEFVKEASTWLEDDPLYKQGINRVWKNLKEGNNILALTLRHSKAFFDDSDTAIRISFNTEYYNNLQTLIIPKDANGKLKDKKDWKIEINYAYNQVGGELDKPTVYNNEYSYEEFRKHNSENTLFKDNYLYKDMINYSYMRFENGEDTNRNAISMLLKFAEKIPSKDTLKYIKENAVYKYRINLTDLDVIDLSERVESKFAQYLSLYNIAQATDFKIHDVSKLYADIFRRVMGNLNALKYGQYLMQMPEAYADDTIIKILDEGIDELNIETLKAAEAAMGWSFAIKDEYSIQPMFGANTNPVRSVLTSNLLYGTFTPIGFNNDIFARAGKNNNLEDYIWDTNSTEFKNWANNKIKEELKQQPDIDKTKYIKERMAELIEIETMRKSLLKKNGNKYLSLFKPRVAQAHTLKQYDEDVLHPLGVNLTVAYTSDVRAFEDDFLIDAKWAKVLGWNEGNKTWTKYGFKGAVKFVEGLEELYGAIIVGKAESVQDRGAYGAYLEMAFNVILDYSLGFEVSPEVKTILDNSELANIKQYDTWEEYENDSTKNLICIVDNKIVTNKSEIIDYADFLDNLIQSKVDLNNKPKSGNTNEGKVLIDLIKTKMNIKDANGVLKDISKRSYNVKDPITGEIRTIIYDETNCDIFRGTIYTLMDAEHTAAHMQTAAQLHNKTDAQLSYIARDINGSVEKGGMYSFTVEQSVAQKIGYKVLQGLIGGDDDETTQRLADFTLQIMIKGLDVFKVFAKDTVEESINAVYNVHNYLPDAYKSYLKEYFYCIQQYERTKNDVWKHRLNIVETSIKEHAKETYEGPTGLGYRTSYRRFWAARNQLLANTTLATGEIKFPANAFDNLKNYNKNDWIKEEEFSTAQVQEALNKYAKEYNKEQITITIKNKVIKGYINGKELKNYAELYRRLRFLGFLDDNFNVIGKITEDVQGAQRTVYVEQLKLKKKFKQTTAYVMAVRSPVQDYGATPVVKITGVVEHGAIEGNPAMYKNMGADNDGDTAAFIACKYNEVTEGVLKNLDASYESFYNDNQLKNLRNKDLGIKLTDNLADNAGRYYKYATTNYAYIGKKTSSETGYSIKEDKIIKLKNDNGEDTSKIIRKGDAHFTYTEMIASASKKLFEQLKTDYKKFKIDSKNLKLSSSEEDDMFWLESHIWLNSNKQTLPTGTYKDSSGDTKSYTDKFYKDKEQIEAYYKANKKEIDELKLIEYYLKYIPEGQMFLEKYREAAIRASQYATLVRGHVSKVNIGKTGGLRKDVNLGTMLSTFVQMNSTTDQEKIWRDEYNIDVNGLTLEGLAKGVCDKIDIFKLSESELEQLISNPRSMDISSHSNSKDYEEIVRFLAEAVIEYNLMKQGMPKLVELCETNTPTYQHVFDLLNVEGEKYLVNPMLTLYRYIKEHQELLNNKIDDVVLNLVKTYYLSRFVNDFDKAITTGEVEITIKETAETKTVGVTEGYLYNFKNQYILTRIISKVLNDTIQEPISLSKHGSSLGDYTLVHEELTDKSKAMAKKYSINKAFWGNSKHHIRAIAMGNEYNIFKRKDIKYKVSDEVKSTRSKIAEEKIKYLRLDKDSLGVSLENAYKAIIKYEIFKGLITDDDYELALQHYKNFTKELSTHISKYKRINLQYLYSKDLLDAIKFFEKYNVSIYNLINSTFHMLGKLREAKSYDMNIEAPKEFNRLVGIISLKGIDKKALQDAAKNSDEKIKYIINYLTEQDNPIPEEARLNDSNLDDSDTVITTDYEYSNKDVFTAAAEQLNILDYEYPTKVEDNKLLDEFVNKLNILDIDNTRTEDGLIEDMIATIYRLDAIRKGQVNAIRKQPKNTVGKSFVEIIKEASIDYENVRHNTKEATEVYNKIKAHEDEINELEKKRDILINNKINLQLQKTKLEKTQQSLEASTPTKNKELIKKEIEELTKEYNESLKNSIKFEMLNNIDYVMDILQMDNSTSIKVLDQKEIKHFNNQLIVNMDNYQHPFHILVNAFTENNEINWEGMYKYIKDNYSFMRITQVIKATDEEGLAKRLIDYMTKSDTEKYKVKRESKYIYVPWEELTSKEKRKNINKHNKSVTVSSFEDLQKLTKESVGDIKYILNKKEYDALGDDIKLEDFITPTLKTIKIKSSEDLKKIWKLITEENYSIGFTYANELLSATSDAYKPYKLEGKGAAVAIAFNALEKALLRMSSGFLLRNAIDTFNQLVSDMYLEKGLGYIAGNNRQILKYIVYGENIYNTYKLVNEERMFTLSEIMLANKNISKGINVKDNLNILYRYLESYIKQGLSMSNPSARITARLNSAMLLEEKYKAIKEPFIEKQINSIANQITKFLGNIKFAEYYEFFDNKIVDGELILGLRIDANADKKRKGANKLSKIISKQDSLYKSLLIEVSAFEQTNAYSDMFKEKQYKELFKMVNQTKYELTHNSRELTIKEIEDEIEKIRKDSEADLNTWINNNPLKVYNYITQRTENIARILGFIFNREIYGRTFDDSVQQSLKTWFNYGQRSPLEIQMMYDIPYISFPIRSIANWRSRLLDPRYAVLMDDIIDGIYSQYADEDGQYSDYVQFMIKSGWIPITDKLGIRAGSGAFDIQNIMTDPLGQLEQRRSPILRGLQAFINSGDVTQAMSQLASVGKLKQATQAMTLGAYKTKTQTMGEPSLGKTFSMFFEYNQYTPKKYDYLYNGNGRYKYYENIYRDWFTKYGRMRKPTVDPVQLVNNIQWKQFLRRMQHKYRK